MKNKDLQDQTAKAFGDKFKDFDSKVQWLYTFEVKAMLERMDQSLTRLYEANCLSLEDFKRFDSMILNRIEKYVFS